MKDFYFGVLEVWLVAPLLSYLTLYEIKMLLLLICLFSLFFWDQMKMEHMFVNSPHHNVKSLSVR